jgi:N6-adenosine-specific RNA methylase IME4
MADVKGQIGVFYDIIGAVVDSATSYNLRVTALSGLNTWQGGLYFLGENMDDEVKVSSIEKLTIARQMLAEAKTMDDILHIRDIAEAARVYARAAKLGLENQNEAAEVKIRAERKAGEMLAQMPMQHGARPADMGLQDVTPLSDLGIEKIQSHRWQEIARLPEDVFEEHITETKAEGKELTTAGLVRVAKFENAKQDKTTPQPMTGKYRIIYADPPWKYGDPFLIEGYKVSAEQHYPVMTIDELCLLPVKEITENNAVLFLWVTSPLLEESFKVIHAWGFEYKTSFVWDKVKHNMGHYNSVRHEFILVCTRGSCLPDNPKLYDSVLSIERTDHSVKPEEVRNIIDDLYPIGKRIELFARRPAEGWEVWGNEPTTTG